MAEKKNGAVKQNLAEAHFGSFHFCGYCPWALLYHTGCIVGSSAELVNKEDTEKLRAAYNQAGISKAPNSQQF